MSGNHGRPRRASTYTPDPAQVKVDRYECSGIDPCLSGSHHLLCPRRRITHFLVTGRDGMRAAPTRLSSCRGVQARLAEDCLSKAYPLTSRCFLCLPAHNVTATSRTENRRTGLPPLAAHGHRPCIVKTCTDHGSVVCIGVYLAATG